MRELTELRKDIDEIDRKMVELFEKRMDISRQVAARRFLTERERIRSWKR